MVKQEEPFSAEGIVKLKKISTSQVAVGNQAQLVFEETMNVDLSEKLIRSVGKVFKIFLEEDEPPEPEEETFEDSEEEIFDEL